MKIKDKRFTIITRTELCIYSEKVFKGILIVMNLNQGQLVWQVINKGSASKQTVVLH